MLVLTVLAALGIVNLGQSQNALAASQLVTDCTGYSGAGRLSAALAAAASGDTIQFQCSGDIVIPSTININNTLTFDATGYNVTLDGNNAILIFNVTNSGNLTLIGLTIAKANNSSFGGALINNGTLAITNSSFISNTSTQGGGAIYNVLGGTITSINNSNFISNTATTTDGGAIRNSGNIGTISSSSFISNTAATGGGAILNGGALTNIISTTFSANSSTNSGFGGAINNNYGGTITNLSNSTFAANSATAIGGAIVNYPGQTMSVSNSTFSGNSAPSGGDIYSYGTLNLSNSLLAVGGGTGGNCGGTITDGGYNLSDDATCSFSATGSQNSVTNLKLDPSGLKNNGGPTQTIAILAGSAAFNSSTSSCPASDQRGYPRPSTGCDIGAYQATLGDGSTASLCVETNLNTWLSGGNYIRIYCPANTTITVSAAPDLTTNFRSLTKNTSLDASPSTNFAISGGNSYLIFSVNGGLSFSINHLTITKGFTNVGRGGAIVNYGTLTITNATFSTNSSNEGGAIYNTPSGTISTTNSTFNGNTAFNGGVIYNFGSIHINSNTIFSSNSVSGSSAQGGAIYSGGGSITISNSTFSANSTLGSNGEGGAIYNHTASMDITTTTFSGNSATGTSGWGGAIYNESFITTYNSTFSNNTALGSNGIGGALQTNGGGILEINDTFSGNAATFGGALAKGYNGGSILPYNTILVHGSTGGNCYGPSPVGDGGYNFSDDNTCSFSITGSLNNATGLNLGALANNGGPTQTILPGQNSIVIDAIPVASCIVNLDQRGYTRPQGNGCDAGAVEVQFSPEFFVANSGNSQQAIVNTQYGAALSVNVYDNSSGSNVGVSGVQVVFTAPPLGGASPSITFSNGSNVFTTTTNSSGIAASSVFTANNQVGAVSVTVTLNYATLNPHTVTPKNITGSVMFSLVNTTPSGLNQLSVNNSKLTFNSTGSSQQTLTLLANTKATNWQSRISYGIGANGWLSLDKTNGTLLANTPQSITVKTNSTNLAAGAYTANLTISDTNNPANSVTVKISLVVIGYSYYLPFLSNAANGYTSQITLQNLGSTPASISSQYFDQNGNLLSLQTKSSACSQVAVNASCVAPNSFSSGAKGTGLIVSNQPLSVLVQETTPFGSSAYAVNAGANASLIAPLAINNSLGFNTQLTIANVGANATTLTVSFYDQNGNALPAATQNLILAAHASQTLDQTAANSNLPQGFYGWAQIQAANGAQLVGQVLETRPDIKFTALANMLSTGASTLFAPAIFNQTFGNFVTGANIVNPNANPVRVSITYYDSTGKAYVASPFMLAGQSLVGIYQGASSAQGLPNGGLPKGFYGSASLTTTGGNVVMVVNQAGNTTKAGTAQSGTYAAGANNNSASTGANIGLPIVAKQAQAGYNSGATILNTSPQAVSGQISYYLADGTQVTAASQNFTIAAHASLPVYQGAVTNLPNGFYGQAVITTTNEANNSLLVTTNVQSDNLFFSYTTPS
jgi:hypothetical protein